MFSSILRSSLVRKATTTKATTKGFHSSSLSSAKVSILGANGGIGQPLSLLCKLSSEIDELAVYDIVGTPGVAADLSHIPTKSNIIGSLPSRVSWPPRPNEGLADVLTGSDLVLIPAGVPRKPGMSRDDLFNTNASIVKTLVEGCAEFCPKATLAIISNPVNSTVPIAAEVLKNAGVYDKTKLCGVTTLDVCRANTFVAASQGWDPKDVDVTVIGGHAGITILPLLSRVPNASLSPEQIDAITVRTQFGGDEVVKAKDGAGSATLSMAYAAFLFSENVLKAMRGEEGIVQCAFVECDITSSPFFATPCKFGKSGGVEEVMHYGELSDYEQTWFDKMLPQLMTQIEKGQEFANK